MSLSGSFGSRQSTRSLRIGASTSVVAELAPEPLPTSRLEELAYEARVPVWELRSWLRAEVERRRAEVPDELRDVAAVA